MTGVNAENLFLRTNEILSAMSSEGGQQTVALTKALFMELIKNNWHDSQVKEFQTPIILQRGHKLTHNLRFLYKVRASQSDKARSY